MNWDLFSSKTQISTKTQKPAKITRNLDSIEQQIVTQLQNKGQLNIDELCLETNINISVLTKTLLSLEFDDILECLPGKRYQLK